MNESMKLILLLLSMVVGSRELVLGQTSSTVTPRSWFTLSPSQLRPVNQGAETLEEAASGPDGETAIIQEHQAPTTSEDKSNPRTNSATSLEDSDDDHKDQMTLVRYSGEFDYPTYRLVHEGGPLKHSEPASDDLFSRVINGIFVPETFRIGKTTVCCSVFTAIERKNPLCLLNPIVLNVSW